MLKFLLGADVIIEKPFPVAAVLDTIPCLLRARDVESR
jgi:hypothetical protein